jgi:type IV pilus assembly protein PilW
MVGIAIGLLVIAVATSALMVSRGVSGTVSDASEIQQQAAYALRVIGGQLRQAGSLRVNLNSTNAVANNELLAPVAFEKKADGSSDTAYDFNLDQPTTLFNGTDSTLTVGFQRYADPVFSDADAQTIARNCLGGPGGLASDATGPGSFKLVQSVFRLDTTDNELECTGNGNVQPIIKNVANFQVRYLRQVTQAPDTLAGNPLVQYMDAASITNWGQVQGVEVCLVIYGNEPIDLPSGSTYRDCSGAAVDMTTLTGARAKRMHLVFRNVFQLRSQGLV